MRRHLTILMMIGWASGATAQPGPTYKSDSERQIVRLELPGESLRFRNGDSLQGNLIGYDKKRGLIWRRDGIKPDLNIDPAFLSRVTLRPRQASHPKPHRTRVQLSNGDELPGDLVDLDDKQLTLKTWYAGQLTVKRAAIRVLLPGETGGKIVYEGPVDAKGWVNNAGAAIRTKPKVGTGYYWSYFQGGFESKGSSAVLARKFPKLPDRSNLEFDVNWTSTLSLYINLHTDNFAGYTSGNSYCVRLTQASALLYKYEANPARRSSARVGNSISYKLPPNSRTAHVSIRVNKTRHTIALVINGRLIIQWTDNGLFAGLDKGTMFTSRTSGPMRLSAIRISHWDGGLPATLQPGANPGPTDLLRLVNNDTFSGQLHHIRKGKATFSTAFSQNLPIPLARISTITLTGQGLAPKPPAGAIHLTLKNRARLTAELLEWKDHQAKLRHPALGEFTLNAAAILTLNFSTIQTTATTRPTTVSALSRRIDNLAAPDVEQPEEEIQIQQLRIIKKR